MQTEVKILLKHSSYLFLVLFHYYKKKILFILLFSGINYREISGFFINKSLILWYEIISILWIIKKL